MYRCIELAKIGAAHVAPNPMVGAVLVYKDRIIGEGFHEKYGMPHAEVNCLNSVKDEDTRLIPSSALYVSLEPCAHHGKTPPCTDLISEKKIPTVVVGCRDPFAEVNGKGIKKLQQAGIAVTTGVLENECKELNKRFFTFHTQQRPYILLKWAQTANGKISANNTERLLITNEFTNRLVHKWRSEEMAILVGTNTALLDAPELTNRLWNGKSPVRIVLDMDLKLPLSLKIFNQKQRIIIFNAVKYEEKENLLFFKLKKDNGIIHHVLSACHQMNIQSIMTEGGAKLLQSFIDAGLWDEARIITNTGLRVAEGLASPKLSHFHHLFAQNIFTDKIDFYYHNTAPF